MMPASMSPLPVMLNTFTGEVISYPDLWVPVRILVVKAASFGEIWGYGRS
jgi:hypothetical protein